MNAQILVRLLGLTVLLTLTKLSRGADQISVNVAAAANLRSAGNVFEARLKLVDAFGLNATNTTEAADLALKGRDYYGAAKLLGSIELQLGRTNEALQIYKGAAEAKKKWKINDGEIYNRLGWAYYMNGDLTNSKANFKAAITTTESIDETTRFKAKNNLGLVYFAGEEFEASQKIFSETGAAHSNPFIQESLTQIKDYKDFKSSLGQLKK